MAVFADDLQGPWRRFDKAMESMRSACALSLSGPDVEDALVRALDEMYRLWEAWAKSKGHVTNNDRNNAVRGDQDGETAAALVFARGENTHHLIRFEESLGLGQQPLGTSPLGWGDWFFQAYTAWSKTNQKWQKERIQFYADRVKGHQVYDPLQAAYRWFRAVIPPPS